MLSCHVKYFKFYKFTSRSDAMLQVGEWDPGKSKFTTWKNRDSYIVKKSLKGKRADLRRETVSSDLRRLCTIHIQ